MDQEGTCVPVSYTKLGNCAPMYASTVDVRSALMQLLLTQKPSDTSGLNNTFAIALADTFSYSYVPPSLNVTKACLANRSTLSDSIASDVRVGTVINMLNMVDNVNN